MGFDLGSKTLGLDMQPGRLCENIRAFWVGICEGLVILSEHLKESNS